MKKTQLFIVIFTIVIMISSVIGFVYTKPTNTNLNGNFIDYKGFKFNLNNNGKYEVNLNNRAFIFDYSPQDLTSIDLPKINLNTDKYYLITNNERNSNLDYSLNKLGYTLNLVNIRPVLACIDEKNCDNNLPIKDCSDDAFYIKLSNLSKVYLQDKCIIIEGDELNINKIIDKINLKLAEIE